MKELKIGSRGSALALAQTTWVKHKLETMHPEYQYTIVEIRTRGDRILDQPLSEIGGKGLFIKELELALLAHEIDFAVHSLKDMPVVLPEGFALAAVPEREDPRDVLISQHHFTLDNLPHGARVGTGSLRRQAQLLTKRPDLQVVPVRGNIDTRIKKLETDNLAAIVLAAAGLSRMNWLDKVAEFLDPAVFVPAPGQGALALEICTDNSSIAELLSELNHLPTLFAVTAERAFLAHIGGSCHVPLGGYAAAAGKTLTLTAFAATPVGTNAIYHTVQGLCSEAVNLGKTAAEAVLAKGGDAAFREAGADED